MGLHTEYQSAANENSVWFSWANKSELKTYIDSNLLIKDFFLIGC